METDHADAIKVPDTRYVYEATYLSAVGTPAEREATARAAVWLWVERWEANVRKRGYRACRGGCGQFIPAGTNGGFHD